jgi:hypothetical protein
MRSGDFFKLVWRRAWNGLLPHALLAGFSAVLGSGRVASAGPVTITPVAAAADSVLAQPGLGAMPGYQNASSFVAFGGSFTVTIDYAVFAPGAFDSSSLYDPTDGSFSPASSDYVYAYQIFNSPTSAPITLASIYFKTGLGPSSDVINNPAGPIDGVGQKASGENAVPYTFYLIEDDATSFNFVAGGIRGGQNSYYLLESSPLPPTESAALGYTGYFEGGEGNNTQGSAAYLSAPAPVPGMAAVPLPAAVQQGTVMLLAISVIGLMTRVVRRRARNQTA